MNARVYVTLKPSVLDPQGQSIQRALVGLGYSEVEGVRVGKYFDVRIGESDRARALARLEEMCKKLLANTVIENYSIEVAP